MAPGTRRKGFFARIGLPLSTGYLYPIGRNRVLVVGAGLATIAAIVLLANLLLQSGNLVSNGPLSSSHAGLESNCVACHTPFAPVSDQKCAVCHEKFTDSLGVYTFSAHYVYVSDDRTRAFTRDGEMACSECHAEHEGRETALTAVSSDRCAGCHAFSFSTHPQFDFADDPLGDDPNLTFTHIAHLERVLDARHFTNHELACLSCHTPTPDGRLFEPISFAQHCQGCHLGRDEQSEELDIKDSTVALVTGSGEEATLALGVETLETVRNRLGPGEGWALSMSDASFEVDGDLVVKIGIEHADPWILHNLRLLRQTIYPDSELSDLLRASPDVPEGNRRELYEEALDTLRAYADELKGRSEAFVQDELVGIARSIDEIGARLAEPGVTLSDARFRTESAVTALTQAQLEEVDEFASFVAQPCLQCHRVERATIARVQADQRVLRRARFNHRAHVLQRDCLSCHDSIPFFENLDADGVTVADVDRAAIHNLPRVEQCQSCHTPTLSSDRCLTCHAFHPVKDHVSRLVLE